MSNALEAASLIMVPSGYEDGTLASVKPNDGTGDFTFSRGSNLSATRINEQGYIEKGYENLLLQSNSFSDAAWGKTGITETGGQSGYNGTSDAWLLEKDANGFRRIFQSITLSGVKTFSVYLKAGTLSRADILLFRPSLGAIQFNVDLSTGTQIGLSAPFIDSEITDVGNGWYKCQCSTNETIDGVSVYIDLGTSTAGTLYIQDAMLNQGLVAYPYIETTTAPVAGGILEDMPRLDWASGAPSLLLEPSRTNLVPHSEYFGAWIGAGSTQTLINDTNPIDGVSYEIESSVTGSSSRIYQNGLMTAGNDYSSSYLVKPSSNSPEYLGFACISNLTPDVLYNFATDSFEDFNIIGNAAKCESISMNNGWKLLKVPVHENVNNTRFNIYQGSKVGSALQGTTGQSYYLKFAQLEQDATYPTSYIPTYGVSQTRLQYSAFASNVASLINSTQGTIFFEGKSLSSVLPNYNYFISLSDSTSANRMEIRQITDEVQFLWRVNNSYQSQIITIGITITDFWKVALKYSSTEIKMFFNGSLVDTISSPTLYSANTLNRVGFDDGYNNFKSNNKVKQALLFDTALSDEECIQLTTV
jgi:hypothetical protein